MGQFSTYIPKLNDRNIVSAFSKVAEKFAAQNGRSHFVDLTGRQLSPDQTEPIAASGGYSLRSAGFTVGNAHWNWARLGPETGDARSAHFDKIDANWQDKGMDSAQILDANNSLHEELGNPLSLVSEPASLRTELDPHRAILLALEGAVAKVLTETAEHRRSLDAEFHKREEQLRESAAAERDAERKRLAAEEERNAKAIEARRSELEAKDKALDERKKELDDRDNTHVRRAITERLNKAVQERLAALEPSKEVKRLRLGIHVACGAFFAVLIIGIAIFARQLGAALDGAAELAVLVSLGIKSAGLVLFALALATWYLRWLNRWFQENAEAELRLQQFKLDIERAAWIVETAFEWRAKEHGPIPTVLLTSLANGLFVSERGEVEHFESPAEQLAAALLGSAANAKLRFGENELTLDRRSLRGLGKKAKAGPATDAA